MIPRVDDSVFFQLDFLKKWKHYFRLSVGCSQEIIDDKYFLVFEFNSKRVSSKFFKVEA